MKLSFFISYSRRDEHLVYQYAEQIQKQLNVTTWLDKDDIPTGRDWWEGICDGIRNSDFFILFLSPHSAGSKYCMAELAYAHALNKVILPILIAETDPLPEIINEFRINYYNLVHYQDSRDVLLSLSKDIFHHLQHPREMSDVLAPVNPDDTATTVSSTKTTSSGKPRELFQQADDAMTNGDYALAKDLFEQVTNGRNKVLARKAKKLLEQVIPLIALQEASRALTDIMSALDDGFIIQAEAEEEYSDFLIAHPDFGYPPSLAEAQIEIYQQALQEASQTLTDIVNALNNNFITQAEAEKAYAGFLVEHPVFGYPLTLAEAQAEIYQQALQEASQALTDIVSALDNNFITQVEAEEKYTELLINYPDFGYPPRLADVRDGAYQKAYQMIIEAHQTNGTKLDLRQMELRFVPPEIGQLKQLTTLILWTNRLTSLPESISKLQQLTTLNLRSNQLKSLPESICKLQQLTTLILWNNQLKSLPESISKLQQLTILNLDKNKLTSLPESIGKLQQLTTLILRNSKLTSLPISIGELSYLEKFNINGNPLKLPEHIERTNEGVLAWLREEAGKE